MRELIVQIESIYGSTELRVHSSTLSRAEMGEPDSQQIICSAAREKIRAENDIADMPRLKWHGSREQGGIEKRVIGAVTRHFNPSEILQRQRDNKRARLRALYPNLYAT